MNLVPYTDINCVKAFPLILGWLEKTAGDFQDAFMSTSRLSNYCKVAEQDGEVYAVFYPDYEHFSKYGRDILLFHVAISEKGIKFWKAQQQMLKEYCDFIFQTTDIYKIKCDFPNYARLLAKLCSISGFTEEAVLREEYVLAGVRYNMITYGILKEEFYNG